MQENKKQIMEKKKFPTSFPDSKMKQISIPEKFFRELLTEIDNLAELKLTIYFFYRLSRIEGNFRYLRDIDIQEDKTFLRGFGKTKTEATRNLNSAIQHAILRGTLLETEISFGESKQRFLFLNTPKGITAIQAIEDGKWRPTKSQEQPIELLIDTSNIFTLYEENIGVITPLIADSLKEIEMNYSYRWIEDAFKIAVENNKRNLRYIEAILKRWQKEGRNEQKDKRDTEEDRRKYVEGKYSEFIDH
jgi:DnaD/phage-associated family protein